MGLALTKILIVEDDYQTRNRMSLLLTDAGYKVVEGKNGEEGIEKARENPDINLVISDFHMGDIDGLEMCQAIRNMRNFSNIPMFMVSTELSKTSKIRGHQVGILTWIAKPYEAENVRY